MPQNDEQQIRTLITDWAAAVHCGQMDRVLADHADDIVMFDVPPPQELGRGFVAAENYATRPANYLPIEARQRSGLLLVKQNGPTVAGRGGFTHCARMGRPAQPSGDWVARA
jgi:hypothetical protein